jgi:7,8-dihydropterin-6-yl-methyl-4-(beta-D-ribofuranosyl)aminobenzene 5'-phosphate synthase
VKITIIYDNVAFRKDLQADWGFSALIETENSPKILFDAGADGKILLNNMEKLTIDPLSIEEIFISHLHADHTGGLDEFLRVNSKIKNIYVPSALGLEIAELRSSLTLRSTRVNEVIFKKPQKIHDNVFSTGELEDIEQGLGVETGKGIVLVVGCSHPEMRYILDTAEKFGKIYAIIGGLHGFSTFELFKDLELICPTHCTQHKAELKEMYPQKYIEGGAGRIIEI